MFEATTESSLQPLSSVVRLRGEFVAVAILCRGTSGARVTFDEFVDLVSRTPGIGRRPNLEQQACLRSDPAIPTMIVAGPGSGKTTVLVLRALRHILVDQIPPEQIVITTF